MTLPNVYSLVSSAFQRNTPLTCIEKYGKAWACSYTVHSKFNSRHALCVSIALSLHVQQLGVAWGQGCVYNEADSTRT